MLTAQDLSAAHDALTEVLKMTQPTDAVLSHYFRVHRELGQHDRAFIAETIYDVLRHRYELEYHTNALTAQQLLLAYFKRLQGISLRGLHPLLSTNDAQWLASFSDERPTPPLYVRAELPQWVVAALERDHTTDEILALGRALQRAAPLDLRINPLLTTRDQVLAQLAQDNLSAHPTPYSPLGIRLESKPALHRHQLFTGGKIEVQDEGSQLVCLLLNPKRREMVVDFCAGAGGKTLAIGALMRSQGRLYAFDISESRLDKLKPRLKRSQLSNVHPQLLSGANDSKVKRLAGKIDRVLVDAPCSGFGTLRRNPDLKWRQNPQGLAELNQKQYSIMAAAAQMLKPGGTLVYATCSILRAENQDIIDRFLGEHRDFSIRSASAALKAQQIGVDTGEFLELAPHRHGCDGFFAALLERE